MAHHGYSGGNMARPSNPSGYLTPSFPAPATFGARAPQLGHPSAADTLLVPPAVAPQTFHFQPESQPHGTMPHQAGVPNAMPLQHFGGTPAVQPPLHGMELAARVAAINTLPPQHFQPNNNYFAHGWSSQAQPLPPPPPQAPPAPRYAAPAVVADGYAGATGWARPMLPASDSSGSWAPPAQQRRGAGGQTNWAPPVQQPGGQASSWAWAPPAQQHRGMPAASPAKGSSAQARHPRVTTGKKTFEDFLQDAGVLDEQTMDKIFVDEVSEEMLGDEQRDDRWVSLGDVLLALGAVSSSGPSTHQVGMPARAQEALDAGTSTTGGGRRDQAAAAVTAEARERRSRRMGKRKEAAARHRRPDKHAAPRGSQNGPGAI